MNFQTISSILLCDDDEPFRRRLGRSLRDRQLRVFEACTADEAIENIEQYDPEGVVTDLRMPGESGLWLVGEICKRKPGMKIVVLTGFGSIATALDAVRLGAINYLTKPVTADALLAAFVPADPHLNNPVPIPSLEEMELEYVNRVLAEHDGNVTQAAKALGLHRRSLQRKIKSR